MKRIVLLLTALFFSFVAGAQNPIYVKIRHLLSEQHPELALEEKLIAFNAWLLEDIEGRNRNRSFDKTYDIYQVAKLTGGRKGLIVVSLCLDGSMATAATTMHHDGVRKLVLLDVSGLRAELQGSPQNMVFDSSGREVYRNLEADAVFPSINKLITR